MGNARRFHRHNYDELQYDKKITPGEPHVSNGLI